MKAKHLIDMLQQVPADTQVLKGATEEELDPHILRRVTLSIRGEDSEEKGNEIVVIL